MHNLKIFELFFKDIDFLCKICYTNIIKDKGRDVMHKFKPKLLMTILLMTVSFFTCSTGMLTYAEETQTETDPASQETFYFEENVQKAKDDTGFVELSPVSSDDIHYGWSLGRFVIT